jgi:hypothetical protein
VIETCSEKLIWNDQLFIHTLSSNHLESATLVFGYLRNLSLWYNSPTMGCFWYRASLSFSFFFFFFFELLGIRLGAYTLSHYVSPFLCDGFFRDSVLWTICLGWLWTAIFLISASWEARIAGHGCPAQSFSFKNTSLSKGRRQREVLQTKSKQ